MCGRVIVDYDEMMSVAADTELADWITARPEGATSSWNVKPTEQLPIILTSPKDGLKRFVTAHWSLVPTWAPSMRLKYPTFNARAEGLADKASFKMSVKNRRCVIVTSGFYEWTGPQGDRTPYAVFGPQKILPLAGLYSWWRDPAAQGEWQLTTTVLTRASAGQMDRLHTRMPVIMSASLLNEWLDPHEPGSQLLVDAVSDASVTEAEGLIMYPVAPLRGDGPELIQPSRKGASE